MYILSSSDHISVSNYEHNSSVGLGVLWSLIHVALYAGDCGVRVVGKM